MTRALNLRAGRHGTKSQRAGDEPRNDELTAHWPEKGKKMKRRRFPLPKRTARLRRKDKLNRQADAANYEARLAAPWPLVRKETQ